MKDLKSFIRGAGSIIDLFPSNKDRELKRSFIQDDRQALINDWQIIGKDIKEIFQKEMEVNEENNFASSKK